MNEQEREEGEEEEEEEEEGEDKYRMSQLVKELIKLVIIRALHKFFLTKANLYFNIQRHETSFALTYLFFDCLMNCCILRAA